MIYNDIKELYKHKPPFESLKSEYDYARDLTKEPGFRLFCAVSMKWVEMVDFLCKQYSGTQNFIEWRSIGDQQLNDKKETPLHLAVSDHKFYNNMLINKVVDPEYEADLNKTVNDLMEIIKILLTVRGVEKAIETEDNTKRNVLEIALEKTKRGEGEQTELFTLLRNKNRRANIKAHLNRKGEPAVVLGGKKKKTVKHRKSKRKSSKRRN